MKLPAGSMLILILVLPLWVPIARADAIGLGNAANFAVLGATMVSNTGASVLEGDLGVYSGNSITGFGPGTVTGTTDTMDTLAKNAQSDLMTAISNLSLDGPGDVLSASSYATTDGETLLPGVYSTGSTLEVAGTLNLDFNDQTDASFVFLVGSALTADGSSTIVLENVGAGDSLYWVMSSSATIGTDAIFEGNLLAGVSITLDTGASIYCGRALASTGAVTLDNNVVSTTCENSPVTTIGGATAPGNAFLEQSNGLAASAAPEPGSWLLLGSVLPVIWLLVSRVKRADRHREDDSI